MTDTIKKLLFDNWRLWAEGGLPEAEVSKRLDEAQRRRVIRWFHDSFDRCGLERPATDLKQIIDLGSWCLHRWDSLLFWPVHLREQKLSKLAEHRFRVPVDVLRDLTSTSGCLHSGIPTDEGE